jgi:hypothetical protein
LGTKVAQPGIEPLHFADSGERSMTGNPMLFQAGHHRAADTGEVILDHLGFGRRQVMDMLVQWRRPLALSQQGLHLAKAAFNVQKRGKQELLV